MWKHTRSRLGLLAVVAATLALLALPAAAAAQDTLSNPSSAQYDAPIPESGTAGASASGTSSPGGLDSNIGSLPFTGLDLIVVAGVAFVLTGTGFALRRLSTPRDPRV
jgi:hypothetical protein